MGVLFIMITFPYLYDYVFLGINSCLGFLFCFLDLRIACQYSFLHKCIRELVVLFPFSPLTFLGDPPSNYYSMKFPICSPNTVPLHISNGFGSPVSLFSDLSISCFYLSFSWLTTFSIS